MASTVSNLTPLGDSKHGGALFTVPREIRDEIYRYLVKGFYLAFCHLNFEHQSSVTETCERQPRSDRLDLVILLISKVISREAQDLLYSESTFRYPIPFYTRTRLSPRTEVVNRMKKIEIYVGDLTRPITCYDPRSFFRPFTRSRMTEICEAIIRHFTGAEYLRDTLHINIRDSPEIITPLKTHLFPTLCALGGFRTIVLEILPNKRCEDRMKKEQSRNMGSTRGVTAGFERLRQAIKDALEPTLGPSAIHDSGFGVSLKFLPREHNAAISRAQAQKLMLDADRLEQVD